MEIKVELFGAGRAICRAACSGTATHVARGIARALARERGDIRALEGPLKDYHRLRIGGYRIIFAYRIARKRRSIQCVYAERRSAVYEMFAQLLKKHLLEGEEP